jgi:hypothetical protein
MANLAHYKVWDFWTDSKGCYAVYEKQEEGKLYFSEVLKEEQKLLEQKKKKSWFKKTKKRKDK